MLVSTIAPTAASEPGSPRTYALAQALAVRNSVHLRLISPIAQEPSADTAKNKTLCFSSYQVFAEKPNVTSLRRWSHRLHLAPSVLMKYRDPQYLAAAIQFVKQACTSLDIDVIIVDGLAATQFIPVEHRKKALVDLCDSLSLLFLRQAQVATTFRSKLAWTIESKKLGQLEKEAGDNFAGVVFISEVDRDFFLRSKTQANVLVVPNGVDTEYFNSQSTNIKRFSNRIVFSGVMNYPPNVDAALFCAHHVFPQIKLKKTSAELFIVGANPVPEVSALAKIEGITVTGTVPDIRPFLFSSALFLSPIRFGAGMKNKILAAMAAGIPVVASPCSVEGIAVKPERHLLIGNTPEEIAAQCLRILDDGSLAESLTEAAKSEVVPLYSWDESALKIEREIRARIPECLRQPKFSA